MGISFIRLGYFHHQRNRMFLRACRLYVALLMLRLCPAWSQCDLDSEKATAPTTSIPANLVLKMVAGLCDVRAMM